MNIKILRILWVFYPLLLGGCTMMSTIAAIPAALIDPIVEEFSSKERSLPYSMRAALLATQRGLRDMALAVDVLEIDEDGYNIAIANENLEGKIALRRQTQKLTTIKVHVKSKLRQESVETAILDQIEAHLKRIRKRERFDFSGYHPLYQKPDPIAERVGWYRVGAQLSAKEVRKHPGWLKLKLPSGHYAFFKRGNHAKHRHQQQRTR